MKRRIVTAVFIAILISTSLDGADGQQYHLAGDRIKTFFAIHCDPVTGYNGDEFAWNLWFGNLDDFIALADSFGYSMTIQFTPQWVVGIMRDESKMDIVAGWAREGHEIAAHHHGVYHQGIWDGFTNLPWTDERLLARLEDGEEFFGTMDLYDRLYDAFEKMLEIRIFEKYGDECELDFNSLCMNDTDQEWDWPSDFSFSTTGIFLSDMLSVPIVTSHNGEEVFEVRHCSLAPPFNEIEEIIDRYAEAGFREVVGMNAHVNDFVQDGVREKIDIWFSFLADSGETVVPVSDILDTVCLPR